MLITAARQILAALSTERQWASSQSRQSTSKQVRGAVLDLIGHPFPKKRLVLLDAHAYDIKTLSFQCANPLGRFEHRVPAGNYRIVIMKGNGGSHRNDDDVAIVRAALEELYGKPTDLGQRA